MIMDSVKKELKYLMRYGKQFKSLIKKDGIGVASDKEYWLAWRPFCKEKYIIFRMHTGFGLGYLIPLMIESFEWANEMGFIPVMYWADPNSLSDICNIDTSTNLWNDFFEQNTNIIFETKVTIIGGMYSGYTSDTVKKRVYLKQYDRGYLECEDPDWRMIFKNYNKYYNKWFVLKRDFIDEIEFEWKNIHKAGEQVLGIMLREEFSIDRSKLPPNAALQQHPWVSDINEVIEDVKEFMILTHCNKVFVASMFEDSIEAFQQVFGIENVIYTKRKRKRFNEYEADYLKNASRLAEFDKNFGEIKKVFPYDKLSHYSYMKEIYFCAKCESFTGHMCSGTRTALIVNGGKYKNYKMLPNHKSFITSEKCV